MKKTIIILVFLLGIFSNITSWGLSDDSSRSLTSDSTSLPPVETGSAGGSTIDSVSGDPTTASAVGILTVTGNVSLQNGKYTLEETSNPPWNPAMGMPSGFTRYNLSGNLTGIEKFVNKRITMFGEVKSGVGNEMVSVDNLQSFYYYEKPIRENKMAEFIVGKLKSVNGEDKYYYVEAPNGTKTFLVGNLTKASNFEKYNVEISGKTRQGSAPSVLKGVKIFDVVNIEAKDNKFPTKRIEVTGILGKQNGKFILEESGHAGGPMGPDWIKQYDLSNNTVNMNKYVGKKISVTGLAGGNNETTLKVYFYYELPEVENKMAALQSGVLKSLKGEEKYYYIEGSNQQKTFIKGSTENAQKLLGKKVTAQGKMRYGNAPLIFKSDKVFDTGNLSEMDTNPLPQPQPQPQPKPLPQPSPIPDNNDFFNNFGKWFNQFFTNMFGLMFGLM